MKCFAPAAKKAKVVLKTKVWAALQVGPGHDTIGASSPDVLELQVNLVHLFSLPEPVAGRTLNFCKSTASHRCVWPLQAPPHPPSNVHHHHVPNHGRDLQCRHRRVCSACLRQAAERRLRVTTTDTPPRIVSRLFRDD